MSRARRLRSVLVAHKFGVLALAIALVVKIAIFLGDPDARHAGGDGHYNWMFARSLALDHDIEFKNDYELCGDPWQVGVNRGTGHPDNKFYAGPALFWVPVLTVVRAVHPLPASASPRVRGACDGPLLANTLATAVGVGMATMLLCYLVALRFAGDGIAALATLLMGLGTPHLAFSAVFVGYALIFCGFAVALYTWLLVRAMEVPTVGRWALAGLGVGLCAFQRLPMATYGLAALVVAVVQLRRDRRVRHFLAVLAVLGAGTLAGLLPTLAIYKYLYGSIFVVPQGRHYVHLTHAHPFLVLFGTHGGLFMQSPIVWLAVLGLPFAFWLPRHRAFVLALLVAACVDLWVASSSLDYHSSWTFGARRLTTWMPPMVILGALALKAIARWLAQREGRALRVLGAAAGLVLGGTFASWVYAYTRHVVPGAAPLTQEQAYGTGPAQVLGALDKTGFMPAVWPGQLYYWARYRLPLSGYGFALDPIWWKRDQVSLHIQGDTIPVQSPEVARQVRGFEATGEGLALTGEQGRLVFAAEWPFATHLAIGARASRDCWLRVGGGRWFDRANFFDRVHLEGGGHQVLRVSIPKSEFDSGVNEFVFQPDGRSCGIFIDSIKVVDETVYPPAF